MRIPAGLTERYTDKTDMNKRNPWAWVPTLYFAEGVPYVAVMTISLIL